MVDKMDVPPLEAPLFGSLSDASGIHLKNRVTELFGHMKELAPQSGSNQSLKGTPTSSDPSIPNKLSSYGKTVSMSSMPLQRQTSISTNRGFQLDAIEPIINAEKTFNKNGSSNMATSKSYTTGLNKSATLADTPAPPPLSRSMSNTANLTSLCVDISPSNSHFFEVLYVGKIKVSHKKVPETLIDDALSKFKQYEVEKAKSAQMRRNSLLSSHFDSLSSERDSLESLIVQPAKKVEFAPLPIPYKKNDGANQDDLISPSLTPLESTKDFFGDNVDLNDVEKEFDELSAVRSHKQEAKQLNFSKKPFPVALEPKVLILNFPQSEGSNLSTLDEDEETTAGQQDDDESPSFNKLIDNNLVKRESEITISQIEKNKFHNLDEIVSDKMLSESRDSFDQTDDERMVNGLKNKIMPENKPFTRDRSASIGTLNLNKTPIAHLIGDQNRTMLFQVARSDLRLISPDRKQVLLHKHLKDVASCVIGVVNREHFGFICRESDVDCFVGYVFKCQSNSVASDVVGAITQAFVAHTDLVKQGKDRPPLMSCEHCPMVWYHKLCQELEGMNEKRMHTTILKRIDQLPEDEQVQITTKYQGGTEDLYEIGEHNAFLMMLLRAHCEAKQQRHAHDTAENRSEFLNQYLGGSTIFKKAKRSLSSSFDHLLKRKASKDELGPNFKKEASPMAPTPTRDSNLDLHSEGSKKASPELHDVSLNLNGTHEQSPSQLKSPMMDIFMKLGNSPTNKSHEHNAKKQSDSSESDDNSSDRFNSQGSWRQAIFNRVVQAGTLAEELESNRDITDSNEVTAGELLRRPSSYSNLNQAQFQNRKRSKQEIRDLWKKSINQAILLMRMEKENARLRARQEVSAVKRIKLEYDDIGSGGNESSKVWDMLTAPRESRISTRVDSQMLLQAIRQGVPRAKRGEVWYFLAEQFCLRQPPPDVKNFPNYGVPYESLLKQLTSHQHAILIDLGRTFPNHMYFASPLGPGQLALFNLLKAYSLLDPEVGYCQGLSFVAGVLLLHLEEAEAFIMLRHLMFRRGLRRQYLPDMTALQIQLYQLSRLLKDHIPELYDKFDQNDVSPTLYAAPWILTIFTSQFPLGFVTRVFDLLFLESSEVIFRVAIALLEIHKDGLMLCDSFEEIMEYLKHRMPNIDKQILDKVIKLTFTLDFSRQLNEYQVEYNVLQEEMAAIAPKMDELNNLQKQSKKLADQNRQLSEQIEANSAKLSTYQIRQNQLESQVKSLEITIANLARYIGTTHDKRVDLPNDIRKICQQVQQNDRKTLGALGQKLGQSFSSKFSTTDLSTNGSISSVSEESSSDPDDRSDKTKKPIVLKTGLSTPNLFNNPNKPIKPEQVDPILEKKRQNLTMKKSLSCNAGLTTNKLDTSKEFTVVTKIPTTLKEYPLRVLEETNEYEHQDKINNNNKTDKPAPILNTIINNEPKKMSKFFASSHEQIRQEKLQAKQLKEAFDDNLRKLDARLTQGLDKLSPEPHGNIGLNLKSPNRDSGIGTPVSPPSDTSSFDIAKTEIVNHPLVGCDIDVKFDVHSTKLKTFRSRPGLNSRTSSIDGGDSRN